MLVRVRGTIWVRKIRPEVRVDFIPGNYFPSSFGQKSKEAKRGWRKGKRKARKSFFFLYLLGIITLFWFGGIMKLAILVESLG